MGRIEYEICDRCGEKISRHKRLLATVTFPKTVKIKWIVTGITSDRTLDLCGTCADELEVFLSKQNRSDKHGEN